MFEEPDVELDKDLVTDGHKEYVVKAGEALKAWNLEVNDSMKKNLTRDEKGERIKMASKKAQEVSGEKEGCVVLLLFCRGR